MKGEDRPETFLRGFLNRKQVLVGFDPSSTQRCNYGLRKTTKIGRSKPGSNEVLRRLSPRDVWNPRRMMQTSLKKLARIQDTLRIQCAFDPLMQGQIFW